jgi:arylsulfatase A-like enzyme
MPGENILVIAVDGLRAASLGAYGNTSFATPALDQFAVESYLFDNAFADAVGLSAIYRGLWQSNVSRAKATDQSRTLPRLLNEHGYTTTLIADEPTLADLPATHDFTELVQLAERLPTRAEEISQTSLGRFFSAACEEIESSGTNRLIWLHCRGFYGPWDAPLTLQEPLLALEEGDPPPSDVLGPPDLMLDSANDSDAAFRWSCAYAAQVMVLDECLAAVRESVATSSNGRWLVILLGLRGFPLGEHGRVGGVDARLYVEQLHVPLLWRFPDGNNRLARYAQFTTHADLLPMLDAWLDGQACEPPPHETLIARNSDGAAAIRTHDWTLRVPGESNGDFVAHDTSDPAEHYELFVRPDDLWEANDVAALCSDVVDDLRSRLADDDASAASPADSA